MSTERARRLDRLDQPTRLQLVENDLDDHDEMFRELKSELARIKGIMIGILVSTSTAAIMLAVNLAVGR